MEITIKTTGAGKRKVSDAAERFSAKFSDDGRGVCSVSVRDESANAFKRELGEMSGVVEFSAA